MDFETDYWVDDPIDLEGDGTFRPGARSIIGRLLLLALLIWVLINMVIPRRTVILQMDLPEPPPAEQIEPHFWL